MSYTVQTADRVWRRHPNQVPQTTSVVAVPPLGNVPDAPVTTPVHLPSPVQGPTVPETTVPVEDAAVADAESPPLTEAPASRSPLEDNEINVSSESRYPTRERRPPARMDL